MCHVCRHELLRGPMYYVLVLVAATLLFWRESPVRSPGLRNSIICLKALIHMPNACGIQLYFRIKCISSVSGQASSHDKLLAAHMLTSITISACMSHVSLWRSFLNTQSHDKGTTCDPSCKWGCWPSL